MGSKWEELDMDCLVNVFERLEIEELTLRVPFVCKSWYKASLHPHCWKALNFGSLKFRPQSPFVQKFKLEYHINNFSFSGLLKFAVNRSRNSVVELRLPSTSTLDDLIYVSNECPSLKILGMPLVLVKKHNTILPTFLTDEEKNHIPGLVAKWKDLEHMHIRENPNYFKEILLQISLHCKNFTGLNKSGYMEDEEALAIADFLPKLKFLTLTSSFLSKEKLKIILEGCRELEELVVRGSDGFEVDEEILQMTSHIKTFEYKDLKLRVSSYFSPGLMQSYYGNW